ncbi:MAG TPA: HEAT repeat domain-containing protein [Thermoanaerobaculia bacterium]|nr:HEAT repeat domain-containing protein [Thermoanaerobaculia bacterium]
MPECNVVLERMPLLLIEALDVSTREESHQHIEVCSVCATEWAKTRQTWDLMGELPELPVPARVRRGLAMHLEELQPRSNVVAFVPRNRRAWLQIAASAMLVVGSFFAGSRIHSGRSGALASHVAQNAPFRLAENMVLPASSIAPEIQGRPEIRNVKFIDNPTDGSDVGVTFDMTSHVTMTGGSHERSFVNLLSYVLKDSTQMNRTADTIQWVKQQYTGADNADPQIVSALASVLKNDSHEGLRLKAADTLRELSGSTVPEAQSALIEALKNDPNPAVRIKAVEALSNLAKARNGLEPASVDTLRKKAVQDDENPYVRVKAAEALKRINL